MQKCTITNINCQHNAFLESTEMSIIYKKLGKIHNEQILKHNRLKPSQVLTLSDHLFSGLYYSIKHNEVVLQRLTQIAISNVLVLSATHTINIIIVITIWLYEMTILDDCIAVSLQVATWLVIIVKLD